MIIVSFHDLAQRRAQFGVTQILLEYGGRSPVEVFMTAMGHHIKGWGETEFDAINDAFGKLTRKIGSVLTHSLFEAAP